MPTDTLPTSYAVTDFSTDPAWHDVFYGDGTPEKIRALGKFLAKDRNRMYHGTDANLPILTQGLLPTTAHKRRRSFQSSIGFVHLSIYPGIAKMFGEFGNPMKPVAVYAVDLAVRHLLPDKDQLRNKRMWAGTEVGDSLAESLAVGHAARIRGRIEAIHLHRIE